ncbi:MAG: MerR family transcriptional regulator [Croceitalea sp.]|nr:MerR family transcriptional regulator [Croceitalea sp.]
MQSKKYISIKQFCEKHDIEESFVLVLQEYELLQLQFKKQEAMVHYEELPLLEKMVRLHQELHINPEGLQVVNQLLQQVDQLQQEVTLLRQKLDLFDDL